MTFPVFIKASRSKINVAKEVREVNRLRLNHEKRMSSALYSAFRGAGVSAAQEYENSGSVARSVASLQERLATIMASQYREVVQTFAARVYDGRKFTSFTDLVSQLYAREGAAKVSNITETTRRQILKAITTGEDDGLGVTKIAKLIRESTSGAIGRARAATIARTETHAAASWATDQANRELGLPGQKKRWVTVQDARSRSHHAAANGQEVGIDEPFIIRYKGQEIRMMHPHDGSGGAANNVNCRCLAVYFSDDDALFADLDAEPVQQPVDTPEVVSEPKPQEPQPSDPFAVGAAFIRPAKNGITESNIPIQKRAAIKKEMSALMAEDASHPNNINVGINWGTRSASDIGVFTIGGASDEAYSFTAQAIKETSYIAQYLGIGRLRGVKRVAKRHHNGNQGGGVMALNPIAMDAYTLSKRGDVERIQLTQRAPEIKAEINRLRILKFELEDAQTAARIEGSLEDVEIIRQKKNDAIIRMNALIDQYNIANDIISRGGSVVASAYKLGDDVKTRPWSTKEYFTDGLDKTRALVYHEFGHHLHQTYKLDGAYSRGKTYIESKLSQFWMNTGRSELDYYAPSTYAMENQYEYFVETFALYMLGKTDVGHPAMIKLIEELLDERGK